MINESLQASAAHLPAQSAERLVSQYYGIEGTASALTSERDTNFKIVDRDGNTYSFRVSNPAEDPALNDFQMRALQHIAAVSPTLPVPGVIRTLNGEAHLRVSFPGGVNRSMRLLSYLPGVMLHDVPRTDRLRQQLGSTLARVGLALRGFFHPAAGHTLAWDIKNMHTAAQLLTEETDPRRRALAHSFVEDFQLFAAPVLPKLRAQVVHNDFNLHNILVDPERHDHITGVLDFGDMVHTALVNDVAVGVSYHLIDGEGDPWTRVEQFVGAYHALSPLTEVEIDLLYDLIAARCVITVAITGWRAKRYPENSHYILRNNARAWATLTYLRGLSRQIAQERLHAACGTRGVSPRHGANRDIESIRP